ncbi:hypothetical protein A4X06_0g5722 [Tilletia controversa]|uniref:Iron-sulfur protein IND1 n=1 Tax=Tilletia controversa TaxID=13291 RepID=A0A8X7MPY9_9BASI|nr:hypothetical protein CF328_g5590 [Tilletia controversa]KAE8245354.1 hypothetical protein A4X06_0g5722 [Tilletia controversa]
MIRASLVRLRPLPHSGARPLPPPIPRRGSGPPPKRPIPYANRVLIVSSAKGGVGKSTLTVNLAAALARTPRSQKNDGGGPTNRVGILDLDIYGPSIPKLMNLDRAGAPLTTAEDALVPLVNYGMPCMSMGFLLPPSPPLSASSSSSSSSSSPQSQPSSNEDSPVVWRGLMVMKAVQQLLFDVDWRSTFSSSSSSSPSSQNATSESHGPPLDLLVIDTPPGTGDVHLSLAQLVAPIDGVVVISTPQKVALADTRKGIAMWNKLGAPIIGLVLNMSHLPAASPNSQPTYLFGPPTSFNDLARATGLPVLGRIPIDQALCEAGEKGAPLTLNLPLSAATGDSASPTQTNLDDSDNALDSTTVIGRMARRIWDELDGVSSSNGSSNSKA